MSLMNDTPQATTRPQETSKTPVLKESKKEVSVTSGELKELTKPPELKITPAMIVWVDTAVKLVSDSPSDISPQCHISRDSWYRWLKLPGFLEWFGSQWKARRSMWVPTLDKMGMNRAAKNFDYWKAMNQKAGELIDEGDHQPRQVVSILGGMTLNTVNYNKVQQTSEQQDT
jgi:hypothetical protein